jgi:methyl-accepting chemotaxis protein
VADQVRGLAQQTTEVTDEIATMVKEIGSDIGHAARTMDDLSGAIADGVERTADLGSQLQDIFADAKTVHECMRAITDDSLANGAEVTRISNAVQAVGTHLQQTESQLARMSQRAEQLSSMADGIHGRGLEMGVESLHTCMLRIAHSAAQSVELVFEQAVEDGTISDSALFDRAYEPMADTNPRKHKSLFDDFTDQVLPAIQEPILEFNPEVVYAGAVDDNGYFPTHNRRYAKPLTGNYKVDLLNNRTKRIFSDRTGTLCGSNTEPFLLQTYKRDTGEVMHDVSVPIYVNGRHWGGFRMGYRAEAD